MELGTHGPELKLKLELMNNNPACDLCTCFKLRPAERLYRCPVCASRLQEVIRPGSPGNVLHCPKHCVSFIPPPQYRGPDLSEYRVLA